MIIINDNCFFLHTKHSTYAFRITQYGHLEHLYYKERLDCSDASAAHALSLKRTAQTGSTIAYSQEDLNYSLDIIPLEFSSPGCGDFRNSPLEAVIPDGCYSCDFIYDSHTVTEGSLPAETLPCAYGTEDVMTLCITLKDARNKTEIDLYYTVYEKTDVITRRCVLKNCSSSPILLRNMASMNLDMINQNFTMITFDGGWAKEAYRHEHKLTYGIAVNYSVAGFFQTLSCASEGPDVLQPVGLKRDYTYTVSTRPQNLYIEQFGELTKHVLPVELNPNGLILHTANKYYTLTDCVEEYSGSGSLIMAGIPLNNQFMGSYYNTSTRLLGDCGSSLYVIRATAKAASMS